MTDDAGAAASNVELVKRFIAAFDRRWPTEDELSALLAPDVRFVERPAVPGDAG